MTEATPTKASFFARAKKAFAGGVAGAVTAGGTALTAAFSDGKFDGADGWTLAGVVVGAFAVGFAAVFVPRNAQ